MKKFHFSSFGFSTILLAFVMICIVTFSTLTLVTANSDYKLSKKVAQKSTDYAKASGILYEKMRILDEECALAYQESTNENDYYSHFTLDQQHCILYEESINQTQTLQLKLQIHYPSEDNAQFLIIREWKIINQPIDIEEDPLNLLD